MIDPDTGTFTATELEAEAARLKLKAKEAKKREAAAEKESAKARLTAFEDARGAVNTAAKAFAKSGGRGTVETAELNEAIIALDLAANVLAGNAVPT